MDQLFLLIFIMITILIIILPIYIHVLFIRYTIFLVASSSHSYMFISFFSSEFLYLLYFGPICTNMCTWTMCVSRYRKSNSWHILPYNNTVVVHPLDGEIYALIINFSSSYEVSFLFLRKYDDNSWKRLFNLEIKKT